MERKPNNDNLHRIAISNLSDPERRLQRWWERKFRSPLKAYDDYTYEELLVCMLEDFYENNPSEMDKFSASHITTESDWDGGMPEEYESQIQKSLKGFFNKNKVDLTKYQSEEEEEDYEDVSDEDILNDLRIKIPSKSPRSSEKEMEFEEDFEA